MSVKKFGEENIKISMENMIFKISHKKMIIFLARLFVQEPLKDQK
jgi:hypothetical protein